MFLGEFSHSLDDKGRLAIPKKFRTELDKGLILTRGLDNCLFVFSENEWKILAEKLKQLPLSQGSARSFVRLMFAGASEETLDKQGRFIIPQFLREYAGIEKNITITGVMNRLEIWSDEHWKSYKTDAESNNAEIAEQLASIGII